MAPPRVLILMEAQWPRALLRAALRQAGYDALGARDLAEALEYPESERQRGPIRLIILDQDLVAKTDAQFIAELLARHDQPPTLVLESALRPAAQGTWQHVLRHPVAIAEIVQEVQRLLPLPTAAQPID